MFYLAILLFALAYQMKYILQNKRTFKGWLRKKCALIPETPKSSLLAIGTSSDSHFITTNVLLPITPDEKNHIEYKTLLFSHSSENYPDNIPFPISDLK